MPSHYSNDRLSSLAYRQILVIANVTERATGKILSGNSTVQCHSRRYKLEFLDMTPSSYKPGLEFTGYVSLSLAFGFLTYFVLF